MDLRRLLRIALALSLFAVSPCGWTIFDPVNDDTDIFLANPSITAERPNVLIFVDNTANWNTAFDTEKSALVSFVNGLSDSFNVGFGMFVETGNPNDNIDGSYIRFGIRQMTATNKAALSGMIGALDKLGDKGNNATYSLAMDEMFRYFAGTASMSGFGKVKRDFAGNTTYNAPSASLAGNPFVSSAATTYVSPIASGCQKNFIVFISNGPAGDNASSLATAQTDLAALVGKNPPDTITITPNGEQGLWSDEYAKFMANSDCNASIDGVQNVFTYTIDVLPPSTGQGPSHTAQLQSMASNGKGKYFAVTSTSDTSQLTNALNSIFQEVQAVNSVFASTTLPVSVNVRGTNLNQVYIGVFRPDPNKSPKWLGNLKLYKLGVNTSTGTLFLADQFGLAAENASTGFITGSATSYWTSASTYWNYRDSSLNGVGGSSDSPDGDLVEKGGAAQQLRVSFPTDQSTRKLYTCVNATHSGLCANGALLSATPFNNTNVTAADLGAFTTYTASTLTSSGTTATLILPAAPNPTWSSGDQIVVAGATPTNYNGTFNLTAANNSTFTYTYTLATAPDATTAQATGTNHNLRTGDLVTVSTGTTFDVTNATVTRVDANNFRYSAGAAITDPSRGTTTVTGTKQLKSITGTAGTTTATAVISGLTQYANGDVLTITGNAAAGQSFFDATNVTISNVANDTVNNNTSFTYTSGTISGGGSAVRLTAPSHNIASSQSNVYIVGSNVTGYNTGPLTSVNTIDANNLTFASAVASVGTGGTIGVGITNFSHPTSGQGNGNNCGTQDVLTVTTSGNHNIVGPFPYTVTIAGGTSGFAIYNGTWTLNSSADVPSTTTFKITQSSTQNFNSGVSGSGNCNFDSGTNGSPGTLGTVVAGKPITSINPIVSATGSPLYASKSISLSGLTALTNATGVITAGRTADGDNTQRDLIIAWVRGADNVSPAEKTGDTSTSIRPSVHGDVLHSRPAVVNYDRYGDDNDIYSFYGSNDGIFHALKGGIANHTTGPDTAINPGTERWGFVAREFFSRLKRLRNQSPTISNINQKDYFADGSIGVYQKDAKGNGDSTNPLNCDPANTSTCAAATVTGVIGDNVDPIHGDKVLLFLSMRRGGNFIYALDVTNPATPKLLWQHSASDTHWSQLGQTWSEPQVAKIQASLGNSNNPDNVVLIFSGGYDDTVEDIPPCLMASTSRSQVVQKAIGAGSVTYKSDGTCSISNATGSNTTFNRTVGGVILVVDAISGNIVWKAGNTSTSSGSPLRLNVPQMTCAIPSDTQVLDKNRDGFADRIYVGDTCGQVWRADISKTDMTTWAVTRIARIASVTGSGSTDITNARKFLFPPDLVFGTDAVGNYTAVLLGSGDREHPFDTVVQNAFYMFKDRDSADPANPQLGAPNNTTVDIAGTYSTPATGSSYTDSGQSTPLSTDVFDATNTFLVDNTNPQGQNGWKIDLVAGEKVVSSSATVAGTTFFNTNQPSATAGGGACGSNLGIAREYEVGFADASATIDLNASGGITIADRSTIHAGGGYLPSPVPVVVEIGGKKYQAVISGTSVQTPPGLTLEKRVRAYWYKEVE